MHAVWAVAVAIFLLSASAEAQTYYGALTTPANSGPGGSCCSSVSQADASGASVPDDGSCAGCSVISQSQYDAFQTAISRTRIARVAASDKVGNGITLTCSTNPSLSGTYAVNDTVMSFLNTIIGYYVANGNALPAAAQNLTVIDTAGNLHSFGSAGDLVNFYKAVSGYWLALLNWKQRTIAGQNPASPNAASSAC